ncbi:MAG: lysophospholipid acyltransferase family protein [Candidatus Aminicenantes bacterium]|nr:lysophospholipid acyltransferase family protein [Candidatus Aminicenantes bacterium]
MSIKQTAEVFVFRSVLLFGRYLPRCLWSFKGRTLGLLFYFLDKNHRQIAYKNLSLAFGGTKPAKELKKISRSSFKHYGEFLFSLSTFSAVHSPNRLGSLTVEGENHLDDALKQKRGALLISAHYGSWEMAPSFLSLKAPVNVIVRPLDNPAMEKRIREIRRGIGAKVIPKANASKHILRALSENEMVAILMDQNVLRSQAVFVDFFGKKAATTPGPAIFHLRTGAPLVPVFCYPIKQSKYCIKIEKPLIFTSEGNVEKDILKITQACTKIIENQIKKEPRFWLWFHDRWRTRPKETD